MTKLLIGQILYIYIYIYILRQFRYFTNFVSFSKLKVENFRYFEFALQLFLKIIFYSKKTGFTIFFFIKAIFFENLFGK